MYRAREKQMSIYDYLPPYHGELCNANRWVRLADAIDWDGFEKSLQCAVCPRRQGGAARPRGAGLPDHPAALCGVGPRGRGAGAGKGPYLQYFLGFESFTDAVPFSSRTVARFRARIPDKAVRPAVRLLRSFQ